MLLVNASNWSQQFSHNIKLYGAGSYPSSILGSYATYYLGFAFVYVRPEDQTIVGVRDHMGLEPFFYTLEGKKFIFGSSLPDILKQLSHTPSLNTPRLFAECFKKNSTFTSYSHETFYQNIFRLLPGHTLHLNEKGILQTPFWSLSPKATTHCENDKEYLEHFSSLLEEAIRLQTAPSKKIALEFSGGLDSASLAVTCHKAHIPFTAFAHTAPVECLEKGDFAYAEALAQTLGVQELHQIDGSQFDPLPIFHQQAKLFAGASPYLFFSLAAELYQAIREKGCDTILSGFGGDQCVSSHAPSIAYYPELLRTQPVRQVLAEITRIPPEDISFSNVKLKHLLQLLKYSHPLLYQAFLGTSNLKKTLKQLLKGEGNYISPSYPSYPNLRDFEYDLIQGRFSHEIRTRVEYCAIIGKAMGFSYAYPLLYPPLLTFCLGLPLHQKKRNGISRYLIRQYLAQYVPSFIYTQKKTDGAHILPGALEKCKKLISQGYFDAPFHDSPYRKRLPKNAPFNLKLSQNIASYMLKYYSTETRV